MLNIRPRSASRCREAVSHGASCQRHCAIPVDKLLSQTQQKVVAGLLRDLAHPLLPQRGQHLRKLTGDIVLGSAQREANPYRLHRAVSLRPLTIA